MSPRVMYPRSSVNRSTPALKPVVVGKRTFVPSLKETFNLPKTQGFAWMSNSRVAELKVIAFCFWPEKSLVHCGVTSSVPPRERTSLILGPIFDSDCPMIERVASSWAVFAASSSLTRCSSCSCCALPTGAGGAPASFSRSAFSASSVFSRFASARFSSRSASMARFSSAMSSASAAQDAKHGARHRNEAPTARLTTRDALTRSSFQQRCAPSHSGA